MRVRATRTGYYNLRLRYDGDEFDIPDDEKMGSWMEPVEDQPAERKTITGRPMPSKPRMTARDTVAAPAGKSASPTASEMAE